MGGATPERIRPGGRDRLGPLAGTDWFRLRWGGFQGSPRLVEGRGLRLSLLERKESDTEPSFGTHRSAAPSAPEAEPEALRFRP